MSENDWLIKRFEETRPHLRAVAYRMLGSASEAEDAVQETWLRLHRADASEVANLGAWLTTVTARVCLDMLRSRKSRREEQLGPAAPEVAEGRTHVIDPAEEALLAHSVGLALLVVLEALTRAECVAFVLPSGSRAGRSTTLPPLRTRRWSAARREAAHPRIGGSGCSLA